MENFDASVTFQGVLGNKIYNATRQTLEDVTKGTNFLASTLDYWTPDNLNAAHPRLTWDDPNRNTRAESDRYLEMVLICVCVTCRSVILSRNSGSEAIYRKLVCMQMQRTCLQSPDIAAILRT